MKKILLLISVLFVSYVSCALTPITGTFGVCIGSTIVLGDTTFGGVWASSNLSVATIGSTGMVTGISAGTTTITYTLGSSYVTATFLVSPAPDIITGPDEVCPSSTITLADAVTGGTWSSSNTYIATVGSGSGVVTGVAAGLGHIVYTTGTGCFTAAGIYVGSLPIDNITGDTIFCAGTTSTLSDATSGGVWSSSDPSVATVSASGVVVGVSSGFAFISYTVTGACGPASVTDSVSIVTTTSPGIIGGFDTMYVSLTYGLSETVYGGTWSSSNVAVASIDATTGVVTGVSAGTATITYSVMGCGGLATTTAVVTISPLNEISGYVVFSGGYTGYVYLWLITYNPSTYDLEAVDSSGVYFSGDSVYYQFMGKPTDSFRIKAAVDSFLTTGYIPTYHTSSFYWHDANVLYHTAGTPDYNQDINMAYGSVTTGPGFIGGNVLSDC